MKKRITIALLLLTMIFILSCVYGVTPSPFGSDRLGRVWYEHEAGWNGVWTRRGYSNVFDAVWAKGGASATAVLVIDIRGNSVRIKRRGNDGTSFRYSGVLSPDGTRVNGNYGTTQPTARDTWEATITR
jgi:hypothetical protein